jgi:hypothetical protein
MSIFIAARPLYRYAQTQLEATVQLIVRLGPSVQTPIAMLNRLFIITSDVLNEPWLRLTPSRMLS